MSEHSQSYQVVLVLVQMCQYHCAVQHIMRKRVFEGVATFIHWKDFGDLNEVV